MLAPPLATRTAEGLALGLHISFQYKLIKYKEQIHLLFFSRDQIANIYAMNGKEYELTFIRIARDTILQVAGKYEAPSY